MKDYTGYNFAAIVGAKVAITDKSEEALSGTLILASNKTICILLNDSPFEGRWFPIEDIRSLTARIKVEDMSVKQLICMMDKYEYRSPKLYETGIWFECSNGDKAIARFGKEINCSDWGWKHE